MDEAREMLETLKALAEEDMAAFGEMELAAVIAAALSIAENAQAILDSKRAEINRQSLPAISLAALVADCRRLRMPTQESQKIAAEAYAELERRLGSDEAEMLILQSKREG